MTRMPWQLERRCGKTGPFTADGNGSGPLYGVRVHDPFRGGDAWSALSPSHRERVRADRIGSWDFPRASHLLLQSMSILPQ